MIVRVREVYDSNKNLDITSSRERFLGGNIPLQLVLIES